MTFTLDTATGTRQLVDRLDDAVGRADPMAICEGVKSALQETALELRPELLSAADDHYARRLIYRCPHNTYSVMAMVWAPGQGTPVHDHAGKWCVECVHRGEIEITGYEPQSDTGGDVITFERGTVKHAGPGDVGMFVPPNEYHAIRNAGTVTAVTMHVYEGEMLWCHAFHPLGDGRFRKEKLDLEYDH